MNRQRSFLPLMIGTTLLLQGCSYNNLVRPEPQSGIVEPKKNTEAPKVSYSIYDGRDQDNAEKALLESFSTYHIADVIRSNKFERDRVNIFVYLSENRYSDVTRYIGLPWALVSICTLTALPYYEEQIHPVEIHILTPDRENAGQVRIIRTEYVTAQWLWLPFIFVPDHKKKGGTAARNSLNYLGLRRIFDATIVGLMTDK